MAAIASGAPATRTSAGQRSNGTATSGKATRTDKPSAPA